MEIKYGTSVYNSFDTVKESVGRVDNVLQMVEDTLTNAYDTEEVNIKQELIENAKLLLQDARKQLK